MVARFTDSKALVFAYTDLVNMGVPASCMHAQFDEVAGSPRPPEEHHTFLEHLRRWIESHCSEDGETRFSEPPRSPHFKPSGGSLQIEYRGNDTDVVHVIIHHSGTLVA